MFSYPGKPVSRTDHQEVTKKMLKGDKPQTNKTKC